MVSSSTKCEISGLAPRAAYECMDGPSKAFLRLPRHGAVERCLLLLDFAPVNHLGLDASVRDIFLLPIEDYCDSNRHIDWEARKSRAAGDPVYAHSVRKHHRPPLFEFGETNPPPPEGSGPVSARGVPRPDYARRHDADQFPVRAEQLPVRAE